MPSLPRLAVIYLSFHPKAYLVRALRALAQSTYPKEDFVFIIVDHPHPQFGSAKDYIEKEIPEKDRPTAMTTLLLVKVIELLKKCDQLADRLKAIEKEQKKNKSNEARKKFEEKEMMKKLLELTQLEKQQTIVKKLSKA